MIYEIKRRDVEIEYVSWSDEPWVVVGNTGKRCKCCGHTSGFTGDRYSIEEAVVRGILKPVGGAKHGADFRWV